MHFIKQHLTVILQAAVGGLLATVAAYYLLPKGTMEAKKDEPLAILVEHFKEIEAEQTKKAEMEAKKAGEEAEREQEKKELAIQEARDQMVTEIESAIHECDEQAVKNKNYGTLIVIPIAAVSEQAKLEVMRAGFALVGSHFAVVNHDAVIDGIKHGFLKLSSSIYLFVARPENGESQSEWEAAIGPGCFIPDSNELVTESFAVGIKREDGIVEWSSGGFGPLKRGESNSLYVLWIN